MTAGFMYRNPNFGTLSITSDYVNLTLRAKHVFGLSYTPEDWYLGTVYVPASANSVLAFYADIPTGIIAQWDAGGGNMGLTFASPVSGPSRPPATVTLFVFDDSGYGAYYQGQQAALVINRFAGDNAFDSRKRYMKPIDALGGYRAPGTSGVLMEQRNYAASVVPAAVQNNLYYQNDYALTNPGPNPSYMKIVAWSGVSRSGSSLLISVNAKATGPFNPGPSPPTINQGYYSYTIIDVAGF